LTFGRRLSTFKNNYGDRFISFVEGLCHLTDSPKRVLLSLPIYATIMINHGSNNIEPERIYLGVGIYMFPKTHMDSYRHSVVHERHGPELVEALKKVKKHGYELGGEKYKRVPRGFDPEHPNADLLLQKGFHVGHSETLPAKVHSAELIDFCFGHYKKQAPIHHWLVAMTERI